MKFSFQTVGGCLALLIALLISGNTCQAQTQGGIIIPLGNNAYGQTNIPTSLTNVLAFSANWYQSAAVTTDGNVVGWGTLGATIPDGISNAVAVAEGLYHGLALLTNGTVVAWGDDSWGQIEVPAGLSNVVAVAAGKFNSLALQQDGTIVGWGFSQYCESCVPSDLPHVKAIASGSGFSLALKSDGTVFGWGNNSVGQTSVPQSATNVVAISAADLHSLALRSDGTVVAWGSNDHGQTDVPNNLSNVIAIAAGGAGFSVALKSDGTLAGWGNNYSGEISFPVWLTNIVSIAAGEGHTLALMKGRPIITQQPTNFTLYSGGNAQFNVSAIGPLPITYQWQYDGTNIASSINSTLTISNVQPTNAGNYSVVIGNSYGISTSSIAVLTVATSSPAIISQPLNQTVVYGKSAEFSVTAAGSLPIYYQWRFNGTNIDGANSAKFPLQNIKPTDGGAYTVTVSNSFGVVTSSNAILFPVPPPIIFGWGFTNDSHGQYAGQIFPPPGLTNVAAIAAGGSHSLALKYDGSVVGWGDNDYGVSTLTTNLSSVGAIAAGWQHSVALKSDGTVVAWGGNSANQTNVPAGLSNAVAIAAGGCNCGPDPSSTLALQRDGTVVGWGATLVPAGLSNIIAIAAGSSQNLALQRDGTLISWGNLSLSGPPSGKAYVVTNGITNIVAVACGQSHALALRYDGKVIAWGNNYYGQTNTPLDLSNVVAIAAGGNLSAALRNDGKVVAWGNNFAGGATVPSGLSNIIAIAAGYAHMLALQNDGTPAIVRQPVSWSFYTGSVSNLMLTAGAVGPAPLSLQWQLNGTNIDGATNSYLMFTNVQPENSGAYRLVAGNPNTGTIVSSNAVLEVIRSKPVILNQLTNLFGLLGGRATFELIVEGSTPITYQWQFNGINIIGATNSTLIVSNLNWTNSGDYILVASNACGVTVSSSNYLRVIAADFPAALNTAGLTWISSGNSAWFPETANTRDGVAAQSGAVGFNGSSTLQTTVNGPGMVTFWWMFSPLTSPSNMLSFSSSLGNVSNVVYSTSGWQQRTFYLEAGRQTLNWKYLRRNLSVQSTALVDQVSFTPFGFGSSPTNFSMSANGFQLNINAVSTTNPIVIFASTNLVNWLPLYTNPATTGSIQFLDVAATNSTTRFYRAQE